MTEKFLVSEIRLYYDGELGLPRIMEFSSFEEAMEELEYRIKTVDKTILEQVDVYIEKYPSLKRLCHKSWRKVRE